MDSIKLRLPLSVTREREIAARWNGRNTRELCVEFGVSATCIRRAVVKFSRDLPAIRERVTAQRQPRASKRNRLQGAGGNTADRAGPDRIQTRVRRKQIQEFAVAAIMAGRPFPVAEALVLAVMQGIPIQCSEAELRRELDYLEEKEVIRLDRIKGGPWLAWIAGQTTVLMEERNLVGSRDIHITITAAVAATTGTPDKSRGLPGALARPK